MIFKYKYTLLIDLKKINFYIIFRNINNDYFYIPYIYLKIFKGLKNYL